MNSGLSAVKEAIRPLAQASARLVVARSSHRLPPSRAVSAAEWVEENRDRAGADYQPIYPGRAASERPPISLDDPVHRIFREQAEWQQPAAFVCTVPRGRVWGRRGAVIADDDSLLEDVSREFGRYQGVHGHGHSIFRQILLPPPRTHHGALGVVAVPGSPTYYHWLFDVLPRIHLLQVSGKLDQLDGLIIDFEGLPFQRESLEAVGLSPDTSLIVPGRHWDFHVEADSLVVPSLPGALGTIADWVVAFLRRTFLEPRRFESGIGKRRLFVSRQRAPSRRELNHGELLGFLSPLGFEEYFPEDHSIAKVAIDFAEAEWIIGLHGGGLANLVFASPGCRVIELLPPRHVDSLFWILSNHVGARHSYLFAEGTHPADGEDLVRNKIDDDALVSVSKLEMLFNLLENN